MATVYRTAWLASTSSASARISGDHRRHVAHVQQRVDVGVPVAVILFYLLAPLSA
jgi:hypothetical protein